MKLEILKSNTSILDYGRIVYGFTPVKKRAKYWGFKDDDVDSVMVDPNKNCFYHNSEFVVGQKASKNNNSAGSIIDFIMNIESCSVNEAIKKLYDFNNCNPDITNKPRKRYIEKKKPFTPPIPYTENNNRNAYNYLCGHYKGERQIEPIVFKYLVKRKMLYEERGKYKNAVFAAYNNKGKMIFAQRCSTLKNIDNSKRKFDVASSSYEECYFINNNASSLVVTEATIDTLSFMSLMFLQKKQFNQHNHLGLTGSNKIVAIYNILDKYPHITKLYLGFDNDEAGLKAYCNVVNHLKEIGWIGKIINCIPSGDGKDMNDILIDYNNGIKDKKVINIISKM